MLIFNELLICVDVDVNVDLSESRKSCQNE